MCLLTCVKRSLETCIVDSPMRPPKRCAKPACASFADMRCNKPRSCRAALLVSSRLAVAAGLVSALPSTSQRPSCSIGSRWCCCCCWRGTSSTSTTSTRTRRHGGTRRGRATTAAHDDDGRARLRLPSDAPTSGARHARRQRHSSAATHDTDRGLRASSSASDALWIAVRAVLHAFHDDDASASATPAAT